MKPALLLFIILLFATISSFFVMSNYFQEKTQIGGIIEGFKQHSQFPEILGDSLPIENEAGILIDDVYPMTNQKIIGDKQEQNIWKEYPIVEVGSYEQTTNNIRYPDNPDEGTCTPAEFCNVFYKNAKHLPSNILYQINNNIKKINDEHLTNFNFINELFKSNLTNEQITEIKNILGIDVNKDKITDEIIKKIKKELNIDILSDFFTQNDITKIIIK